MTGWGPNVDKTGLQSCAGENLAKKCTRFSKNNMEPEGYFFVRFLRRSETYDNKRDDN